MHMILCCLRLSIQQSLITVDYSSNVGNIHNLPYCFGLTLPCISIKVYCCTNNLDKIGNLST